MVPKVEGEIPNIKSVAFYSVSKESKEKGQVIAKICKPFAVNYTLLGMVPSFPSLWPVILLSY